MKAESRNVGKKVETCAGVEMSNPHENLVAPEWGTMTPLVLVNATSKLLKGCRNSCNCAHLACTIFFNGKR